MFHIHGDLLNMDLWNKYLILSHQLFVQLICLYFTALEMLETTISSNFQYLVFCNKILYNIDIFSSTGTQ